MNEIKKYPRTPHIQGSRLQPGDEDLEQVPFEQIKGRYVVIEEKVDGSSVGISFSDSAELLLQSRGHYLTGGYKEKQYNQLKVWASAHEEELFDLLSDRFIMYGEWLYARHSCYYDLLSHYLYEFDILDKTTGKFLSTKKRWEMLQGSCVISVPVLYDGSAQTLDHLKSLISDSLFRSYNWQETLKKVCKKHKLNFDKVYQEGERSDQMEGLYLKVEKNGEVVERYKFIRPDFVQAILDSGTHWHDRPIIPNQLRDGVDIMTARRK